MGSLKWLFFFSCLKKIAVLEPNKRANDFNRQKLLAQQQSRMRAVFSMDQLCCRMMEVKYRADSDTQTGSRLRLNTKTR